jgi:hypothetical protein
MAVVLNIYVVFAQLFSQSAIVGQSTERETRKIRVNNFV